MKIKKTIIFTAIFLTLFSATALQINHESNVHKLEYIEVNDIAQSLVEQWNSLGQTKLPCLQYGLEYAVTDSEENLIAETKSGIYKSINTAIENRDTIVDIRKDEQILGKLIIYNDSDVMWKREKVKLLIFIEIVLLFTAVFCIMYSFHIYRSILLPFHKLKEFARNVAEGKLDVPLNMDKDNKFGAFTESFDLMRDELNKARENERKANQSKKELVASLSHDIKTPVASIKAVSEIMHVKAVDNDEKEQLEIISEKADQINALITNMFHATLEELQELKVTVTEQSSQIIYNFIKRADYNKKATIKKIPECIVIMDELRLSQVIDNVISNAYKYAGTKIDVTGRIKGRFLELFFQDYGDGVNEDELPLICHKFYRAGNSAGKSGAGLGLYISDYLMNKMSGDINCENTVDGFIVRLKLLLA